jgi:HK97 family phage major capsid protein
VKSLKELIDDRNALVKQERDVLDRADADKRDLNSEERAQCDKLDKDIDALNDQIEAKRYAADRRTKLLAMGEEAAPRQTAPSPVKPRGGDGASLEFDFGRAGKLTFKPDHPMYELATDRYRDGFNSYLAGSFPRGGVEQLGLIVGSDPKGGYMAPVEFVSMLIKFLDNLVFMRRLGTVLPPTSAKTVGALSYDTDPGDADWTAEVPSSDISEDDAMRWGKREMTPHLLSKLIKASLKLVRAYPGLAGFVAQRLAYIFGVSEEKAFLTGSGSNRPLGVFTASTHGITTSQDVAASSQTAFVADDLINTLYDLKDQYVANATWIGTREFRKRCRKLKDGEGRYLLVDGGNSGTLTTLLERPLVVSEYAPQTYTSGLYVAAVGDLSHYWIQDGLGLEVVTLLELFQLKNQVGWIARKETDGMPVLAEAFRRLKLA